MAKRSRANYALLRFVLDIALTELALFLAGSLQLLVPHLKPFAGELVSSGPTPGVYLLVVLVWGAAFLLQSIYVPRDLRAVDDAQAIFVAVTLATLTLTGLLFFLAPTISRLQILIFYALTVVFLIGSRLIIRLALKLGGRPRYAPRRVLILGAGDTGCDVCRMISNHQWAGLDIAGFLDDDIPAQNQVEGYTVLGKIAELDEHVRALGIDEVVVALPLHAYDRFFRLIGELQKLPAKVRIVPDHIKMTLFRSQVEELAGVPMITIQRPVLTPFERQIKRAFDLILGTIAFLLISPLLIVVAVAVRLDSPGPVLFRQQRVGENARIFWMYKFRSMVQDAEKQQVKAMRIREDGKMLYKHPDDPRVTRVGKFIRRTSVDEFPQLFNVLKGEMSLVGPRPELPWLVERYEPWQWQRFSVPQGITGWWQVNGRSDKPMYLYTEEDLFYIQNYSFLLDIQILWRTVGAVVKSKGAF
jgi:exopolysaccharide biosynthesis polyprenyl glycosylphosphotransferase